MKKILLVFALLCTALLISCGSSKNDNNAVSNFGKLGQECYPNKTCDEGFLCDTVNNVCIEDPENPINDSDKTDSGSTEKPDSDSDNGDSSHDNGDTQSDNTDTANDSGDSAPDSDNSDTANDNPANLPECSPTSATPCIDSEVLDADSEKAYLIWSGKSPERLRWVDAVEYCSNLNEGGFNDWQFPTLAALQTLLRSGTYCELGDHCSKFGDIAFFWSSEKGYGVDFYTGKIPASKNVDESFDVRCLIKEITSRHTNCIGLPENAQWNSVSEINQTWTWGSPLTSTGNSWMTEYSWGSLSWAPSKKSAFSFFDEPSATECRFKCNEGHSGSACNFTCAEYTAHYDSVLCNSDCSICRGCKPGYFWDDYASYYVDTGGDPDYHCVPCVNGTISFVDYLRNGNYYCPGGDDLKGKNIMDQIEKCPQYTHVNDSFDDCVCPYGVPPQPKEDCHPSSTRKKTIIISPKVNSSL